MSLHIGVIGDGVCSRVTAATAERVGSAIGRAGAVLLCGGRAGVMEAASRGQPGREGRWSGSSPAFAETSRAIPGRMRGQLTLANYETVFVPFVVVGYAPRVFLSP